MTRFGLANKRLGERCAALRLPVLALVCLCSAGSVPAEWTVDLRVIPGYYIPIGENTLMTLKPDPTVANPNPSAPKGTDLAGPGGAAVLDITPFKMVSFFAQGEYVRIGPGNIDETILTDGSLGFGLIWRPMDRLSLRGDLMGGGWSANYEDKTISGISAGVRLGGTFHISPMLKTSINATLRHYAYTPHPFMDALSVGAGVSVDLTELLSPGTRIRANTRDQAPVFPVFYSWYDDNHFAIATVTNEEPNDITEVKTYFYLEQYMSQPKLCATNKIVKKGESIDVPVRAFFNESMLELTERVDAPAKIIVEYKSLGSERRMELPVEVPVYHRNAMNWEDDRRAAAFVSSKDPAAMWFSKYSSSIVRDRFREGINRNMQYAAGAFESLNAFGLNYVIDPTSAYADNTGSMSIDFLQFPYQTLMYRGGDCDDISILYCSLLEAIGIDTAFVTIPGHIFMAFSSGMTEVEARRDFYAPSQLVFQDGIAWVPVEITLTKEGFSKAWRIGAKEWNDANKRGQAKLFPMRESWKTYKPVSVPGAISRFNLPDAAKTELAFDKSLDALVQREIRPQIDAYQARLAIEDTPDIRNRLGVLYGKYGMLRDARAQFAIAAGKGYRHARVNLGNVAFLEQDYESALGEYKKALASHPDDSLSILGAARCYYELDDYIRSDTLYAELGTRDAVLTHNYAYLGSFFETKGRAWSLADRLSTTTWSLPSGEDPVLRRVVSAGYADRNGLSPADEALLVSREGVKSGGLMVDLLYSRTPESPDTDEATAILTSAPAKAPAKAPISAIIVPEDEFAPINRKMGKDEDDTGEAAPLPERAQAVLPASTVQKVEGSPEPEEDSDPTVTAVDEVDVAAGAPAIVAAPVDAAPVEVPVESVAAETPIEVAAPVEAPVESVAAETPVEVAAPAESVVAERPVEVAAPAKNVKAPVETVEQIPAETAEAVVTEPIAAGSATTTVEPIQTVDNGESEDSRKNNTWLYAVMAAAFAAAMAALVRSFRKNRKNPNRRKRT